VIEKRERHAFESAHINELWMGDTTFGVSIKDKDGKTIKLAMIGFIDDASRKIMGCYLFTNDNTFGVITTLKRAVLMYGKPKAIFVDNGKPYVNHQINKLAGRIGIELRRARPYSPESKAKIERFWRTLKTSWLNNINMDNYTTIGEIQSELDLYISAYNNKTHSIIKMSPNERYNQEINSIVRMENIDIENNFICSEPRNVSNVGTIKLKNNEYEVNQKYIGQRIDIYFKEDDLEHVYLLENKKLVSYNKLNKAANNDIKREKINFASEDKETK
jgi:transposase